jgi:prolyl oligopeptidase
MTRTLAVSFLLAAAGATFADEPKDPFQWLEDVTGEKALSWVKERNATSTGELTRSPEFQALNDRLLQILDSRDRIPGISKHGKWFYNFWRDEKNKRGLWRRTTLDEYRKDKPNWETVLDLDELAAKEKENWVWGGANFLRPADERCLISVSRGGADAKVVREFDVLKKEFVKDGFELPEAKSRVSWKDLDTLYVGTDFGRNSLTRSGYPRVTKEWKRGTKLADAPVVFEGQPEDVSAGAFWDRTRGFEREFAQRGLTFYTNEMFVRKDGKFVKLDKPDHANAAVHREWLFITPRKEWTVGGKTYSAGSLLAVRYDDFLNGKRDLDVLFEPTERKSLGGFTPTLNRLILNELDNVVNRLYVLTPKGGKWEREPLPVQAEFAAVSAGAVDEDESDDYFLTVSGYLTRPRSSSRARRSSTPRGWRSASTRPRRRTGRRSPTSR